MKYNIIIIILFLSIIMKDTTQTQQKSRKEILVSHGWIVTSGVNSNGEDMDKVGSRWDYYPNGTLLGVSEDKKDSATVTWEITPDEKQIIINKGKGGKDECTIIIIYFSDTSMKVTIKDINNDIYYFVLKKHQ